MTEAKSPTSLPPELKIYQLETQINVLQARLSNSITEAIQLQTQMLLLQADCQAIHAENDDLRQAIEKLTAAQALPVSPTQSAQLLQQD